MESIFTYEDRLLIANLTAELKRLNDSREREQHTQPDFVLSIQEAAKFIGRSRQTISKKIRENKLHKVERGGVTGILYSELKDARNSP